MMANRRSTFLLIWVITAVGCLYVFLKCASPKIFQMLMAKDHPMPTPSTLMMWYMIMGVLAGLVYATTSNQKFVDFLSFLLPDRGPVIKSFLRKIIFVGFPALVGWFVYTWAIPGAASPVELRIQHPTLPQDFEKLENPFRQADADVQRRCIEEGKVLFQTYCRPCHGSKADGNGPFANSFRLRPINFQDPGTIATVVDNYLFWRIKDGGPGLPAESTPWDSAMPSWKDDLKDDEIWKIIMGEYDTAGVMPRQREKLE
ncbi:MAG: c-type cytochrome [Candidatus Brocadia sp. BROELEC01]|nr:c-type cytochrome [Candidatus Brocadia sapporoensis]QQR66568.1 MAG: c-type cytochrome [Candidatus Brocadia sp.]RZV56356.1 MAG: c-type cytochrome [Candidatus Brocadia sp. BROELEC01]